MLLLAVGSVLFSMILAATWAAGEYPLQPFLHLQQMERLHGSANAFGFVLCGMLGWILATSSESRDPKRSRESHYDKVRVAGKRDKG